METRLVAGAVVLLACVSGVLIAIRRNPAAPVETPAAGWLLDRATGKPQAARS